MKKLEIKYVNINEIKPYKNNPRINDKAVPYVMNSIKEFGFRNPIILDKNNVIVCGHTRLLSAEKLGLTEIPCIYADDLTPEQIKAFRLADNKVSEKAEWDFELLDDEINDILNINMTDFGFDFKFEAESNKDEEDEEEPFDDIEKLEKHYGVPYQGNKSRIADIIINVLPSGKRLVDLFGGGGAITHCALLSGKWEHYLYNDINPLITTLFIDAVNGKYRDERRVITREDFERLKDTDAYVKYIWSFGNNGNAYLWGKHIEKEKCLACEMILEPNVKERRLKYSQLIKMIKDSKGLTDVEILQALIQLEALQRLEVSNISYKDYKYQDGDIVYCDIPYENLKSGKCKNYGLEFNNLEFYEWCKKQNYQIFFSSYEISDDSFYKVKLKSVMSLIGANTNDQFINEYLYSNKEIKI